MLTQMSLDTFGHETRKLRVSLCISTFLETMQKTHSKINYCAEWITSSSTAAIFQRKGLITHLRDWVTGLRLRPSVHWPILSAPQPQLKLIPENRREGYNLMGFQNCVICTTDIARVKLAASKTSGAQRGVSERLKATKRKGNINPCAHPGHGNREATICAVELSSVFLLHAPASNLPKTEWAR